jgi:hypothetical protein
MHALHFVTAAVRALARLTTPNPPVELHP